MVSRFGKRLLVAALSVAALVAGLVATPAAATPAAPGSSHSHPGEWSQKSVFDRWTTDGGATWVTEEPADFDPTTLEYSSDSGVTWTATQADYNTGEAGTDSNDGPTAGQFRFREPHTKQSIIQGDPKWSIDAGATWTVTGDTVPSGFDFTTEEWSSDSGASWGATEAAYDTGEAGTDSNDGPDAGQFRYRQPHQRQRTWVCLGEESVFTEIGGPLPLSGPTEPCVKLHRGPHNTNVDDGTEPPGDWCAVGASAIICRGDGYTYHEARRQLGF